MAVNVFTHNDYNILSEAFSYDCIWNMSRYSIKDVTRATKNINDIILSDKYNYSFYNPYYTDKYAIIVSDNWGHTFYQIVIVDYSTFLTFNSIMVFCGIEFNSTYF